MFIVRGTLVSGIALAMAFSLGCGASTPAAAPTAPATQGATTVAIPSQCAGGALATTVADGPNWGMGVVATRDGVEYWFPAEHDAEACQCAGCERASCNLAESAPIQAICNATP